MFPPTNLAPAAFNLPRHALPVPAFQLSATQVATTTSVTPTTGVFLPSTSTTMDAVFVTITGSASSATTSATTTAAPYGDGSDNSNGECRLLGSFALLVQLALGALALLSLVYKRWRERPQRPVKIWFFDVSKQVFGSVLVHMANVFMSLLTSGRFSIKLEHVAAQTMQTGERLLRRAGDDYTPNPCSFYLLNLAIDTTLGIPILIFLLRIYTGLVSYTPWGKPPESIQSGNYGRPPNAWWWLKQSVIYFCGLFGMKICVLVIFLMLPWISRVGDWALSWTEGNEQLQIVFVMMLFPLIMNALQYYIIDSFIKKREPIEGGEHRSGGDTDSSTAGDSAAAYEALVVSGDVGDEEESGDEELAKQGSRATGPNRAKTKDGEYDPAVDGDSQTVTGGSSSRPNGRDRILPKELYPPE